MAGSIKYFVYTSDSADDWALKRDESNVEAVNGAVQDFPAVPPTQFELPRNITPRYATYVSQDGTVRRNVVCLTPAIYNGIETGAPTIVDQTSGLTLSLKGKVGERIRLPFGVDTGLTDGDNT